MGKEIKGIKLIKFNTHGVDNPDDTAYPFKLYANFYHSRFMAIAAIGIFNGDNEEIIVRGMTREALEKFVTLNKLKDHPRLVKLEITEGNSVLIKYGNPRSSDH